MAGKTVESGLVIDDVEVGHATKAGDLVGFENGKLSPAVGAAGVVVEAKGVALTAGKIGDKISIGLRGEVSGLSGLPVRGGAVYLSDSDEGGVSGSEASGAGALTQVVGWVTDDAGTRCFLTFQDAGLLN